VLVRPSVKEPDKLVRICADGHLQALAPGKYKGRGDLTDEQLCLILYEPA